LHELYVDSRATAGREMRLKPSSEFFVIAAYREAERHSNVTPFTLQLRKLDRLSAG
jgi:hypothetical protein